VAELGLLALFIASLVNEGREGITRAIFLIGFLQFIISGHMFEFVGLPYYLSAASACMIALVVLTSFKKITPLHIDLSKIFLVGILLNFVGYAMYEAYIEPWYYNGAFGLFYLAVILRLFIRKGKDGMEKNLDYSGRIRAIFASPIFGLSQDKEGRR